MRAILDAAMILRNPSDAPETATGREAGLATDSLALFHAEHANADSPDYRFKVVIHNIAVTGNPTGLNFIVEVAGSQAFASGEKEVGRAALIPGVATLEITLSVAQIRKIHANPKAIRIGHDITGGTTPTVSYGAFVTKL